MERNRCWYWCRRCALVTSHEVRKLESLFFIGELLSCQKCGINVRVPTPQKYEMDESTQHMIES